VLRIGARDTRTSSKGSWRALWQSENAATTGFNCLGGQKEGRGGIVPLVVSGSKKKGEAREEGFGLRNDSGKRNRGR